MRIDYHTHHERCGHAKGKLEEYVLQAIEYNFDQIGLSDHMPLIHVDPATYLPEMAMPMDELPAYVEECFLLKEKYKDQIDVRVGLEADYIEGYEREIERLIARFDWDYVIGSVHFLGTWDISDYRQVDRWEGKNSDDVFRAYYDAVTKAAKTGFYDFIGHIDVIKRFGHRSDSDPTPWEDEALKAIAENGLCIEINASGLNKPIGETFPSKRILERAYKLGIPVTLGSDAHKPTDVGLGLDQARKLLKDVGYTQLATFRERKRIMIELE